MKTYQAKTRYQENRVADVYDQKRFSSLKGRWTDRLEKARFIECMNSIKSKSTVLDIPCGTGRFSELVLKEGCDVICADISKEMLNIAKRKLSDLNPLAFEICDIEKMPFNDDFFDCVICIRLLHHIPPNMHINILTEIRRVTNGFAIITFSNNFSLQNLRRNIISTFTKFPRYSVSLHHMQNVLNSSGFKIIKQLPLIKYISEEWFFLVEKF